MSNQNQEAPEAEESTESENENSETEETEESEDGLEKIPHREAWDKDRAITKIRKLNAEVVKAKEKIAAADARVAEAANGGQERVTALEAENMRLRIGMQHGLPEALVKRLSGGTEEEMLQDAQELMELFGGGKKPPTQQPREKLRGGGDPTQQHNEDLDDLDKFAADVFKN